MIEALVITTDPRDPSYDVPFGERLGNCYELAARYVVAEADAGREGALVHGTIHGVHFRVDAPVLEHAWVECADGGVFEPTSGNHWPHAALFLDLHDAVERVRYTAEQTALLMLIHTHYGPFDYCDPCLDDDCGDCVSAGCGCAHREAA